jgi:hypothetical protein
MLVSITFIVTLPCTLYNVRRNKKVFRGESERSQNEGIPSPLSLQELHLSTEDTRRSTNGPEANVSMLAHLALAAGNVAD